jgi:hypothetical protein
MFVFEPLIVAALSMEVRVALVCSPFFIVRAGSAIGNRSDSRGRHRSAEIACGDPGFRISRQSAGIANSVP